MFTVLAATDRIANVAFAGIPIGLVLTLIHLVGIPVDNTSVNPARSIGPAIFVGGWALGQLWLFIVAPLIGAVGGALVHRYLFTGAAPVEPEAVRRRRRAAARDDLTGVGARSDRHGAHHAVAAASFRLVERPVGRRDQLDAGGTARAGDADADRERERLIAGGVVDALEVVEVEQQPVVEMSVGCSWNSP